MRHTNQGKCRTRRFGIQMGLLGSAAALAFVAGPASADESASEPFDIAGIDIVTVYATSNPLPVFDYPGQVSVVEREEIELFAPSAVSDLLRDLPGVEFAGGPRRTGEQPRLRGFGRENVLILLDGARQSFISAHDGRFFVDPELLRSAEVVRGGASALYGSGAVGGVLAFETVDASDLLREGERVGARLRVGYQDVNEEVLASLTGFGVAGPLDLVASIGYRDSGDISLGSGFDLPSDDDIVTGLAKARADLTDALTIEASWTRFANDAVEPNNGQGVALSSDPTLSADVDKEITSDTYRGALAFNPNDWIDARVTLYRADTSVDETDPSVPRTTVREIETTGLNIRNASRFDLGPAAMTLTLGGDWYRDEQVGTDSTSASGGRAGVPNGEAAFLGLFAQFEARVENPLGLPGDVLIIPGVRFDNFSNDADGEEKNEDEEVSVRVGASYGPVSWLRLFGSYSEAFRAPSINELYLDGVHFPGPPHPVLGPGTPTFNNFVPNPNLTPETSVTWETGIGVSFAEILAPGDMFQAKASYFDTRVDDLINLTVDAGFDASCFAGPFFLPCTFGTTNSANLDEAEISGVELEAVYDSTRVRARLAFARLEGEDANTGADIGGLTPDRLNLDLRLKFPDRRAALGTRLQLADSFERSELSGGSLVTAEERDGYAVVDLYASWAPAFIDGLRIDAGVDNLFDTDYERVFEGVSEPGINPRIAVSYRVGF